MEILDAYILIVDGSGASGVATNLLRQSGVSFRSLSSDACDHIAPELVGPEETYSGLEDISRFILELTNGA